MTDNICQIAISVTNRERSVDFYQKVLDMDYVFSTRSFRGKMAEQVQGIKNIASEVSWLIDDRAFFQLEVFQFENPIGRIPKIGFHVKNKGYNRIIVAVNSIDQTRKIAKQFCPQTNPLISSNDKAHLLLTDPDGLIIELIEDPDLVLAGRRCTMIGMGLTTTDINTTTNDFCKGFGFYKVDDLFDHASLHAYDDSLIASETLQLTDMYLVISEYKDVIDQAADYRLTDIGVLNFATGHESHNDFMNCFNKTQSLNMQANCEPVLMGSDATIVYNNTTQGFSVEMIYLTDKLKGIAGFTKPNFLHRLLNVVSEIKAQREYKKRSKR